MTNLGMTTRESGDNEVEVSDLTSMTPDETRDHIVEQKEEKKAPDGGWGWFVVIGATLVHILMGGVERSTGVLYLEIQERFQGSASATSWLFSIFSTLRPLLGPVSSALSNRLSCRLVVFLGGVLASVSLISSAFATSLTTLFFSFSILGGIGQSFAYTPSLIMVGYYFNKRRGLAVGLATSGVGIGTFLLTPLFEILFSYYGFRGALLVMGGIVLNFVVAASLFRPLTFEKEINMYDSDPVPQDDSLLQNIDGNCHDLNYQGLTDGEATVVAMETNTPRNMENAEHQGLLQVHAVNQTEPAEQCYNQNESSTGSSVLQRKLCRLRDITESKKANNWKKQPLLEVSLLKNFHFLSLCVCLMLFTVAYESTFVFLPSLVTSLGISKLKAAAVVSLIGICDAISRIVASFILDLKRVKPFRLYIYNGVLLFIGAVCVTFPSAQTFPHFAVCGVVFGLLTGVYKSQKSVVIVDILGAEKLSSSFGLLLLFQGIGSFIGPSTGGAIRDSLGSYSGSFYLGSAGIFLGSIVLGLGSIKKYIHDKRTNTTKSTQ